jgi:nitroimidazol reductase NimA-like FMN-containing flavoprotein (pyridoxamine 5'-phosphate oxidase superfamily)
MGEAAVPHFRALDRNAIEAVLARNDVGRIAYARGSHIDIEPIHYVFANGWLYGHTAPGRKLEMTGAGWWPVAFEVDEIEDPYRWRSVVVHGGFYSLDPEGSPWEREEAAKAERLLRASRRGSPSTLDAGSQKLLFRIAVQEVAGREVA